MLVLFNKVGDAAGHRAADGVLAFRLACRRRAQKLETYKGRPEVNLLPLYTIGEGGSVLVSSDTWPGTGGVLGLTKEQIAENKAKGVKPRAGPASPICTDPTTPSSNIGATTGRALQPRSHVPGRTVLRQLWYQKHLNANVAGARRARTEANCQVPRGAGSHLAVAEPGRDVPLSHRRRSRSAMSR